MAEAEAVSVAVLVRDILDGGRGWGGGVGAGGQWRDRSQLLEPRLPPWQPRSWLSEAVTTETEAVSIVLVAAAVLDGGRGQAVALT